MPFEPLSREKQVILYKKQINSYSSLIECSFSIMFCRRLLLMQWIIWIIYDTGGYKQHTATKWAQKMILRTLNNIWIQYKPHTHQRILFMCSQENTKVRKKIRRWNFFWNITNTHKERKSNIIYNIRKVWRNMEKMRNVTREWKDSCNRQRSVGEMIKGWNKHKMREIQW